MALTTTTRNSERMSLIPTSKAIIAAMEVATLPESADYLVNSFAKKAKSFPSALASQKSVKKVEEELITHRENTYLRQMQGKPWSGQMEVLPPLEIQEQSRAVKIAKQIKDQVQGGIKMDLAISNDSELIRGFSSGGKSLDKDMSTSFDHLLNSWFAKHQLLSQGSVVYEGTEQGKIRRDEEGNPITADAEKVKTLISDKKEGIQQFLKTLEIKADVKQHPYPEQKVEAVKGKAAQKEGPAAKRSPDEGTTRPSST